jgi:hypothetical protein
MPDDQPAGGFSVLQAAEIRFGRDAFTVFYKISKFYLSHFEFRVSLFDYGSRRQFRSIFQGRPRYDRNHLLHGAAASFEKEGCIAGRGL